MSKRSRKWALLVVAAAVICAIAYGCLWLISHPHSDDRRLVHMSVETHNILAECAILVSIRLKASPHEKFETSSDLVRAVNAEDGGDRSHSLVDKSTGLILDAWGRPVVVIQIDGQVHGVASLGADGKWDDFQNDDIMVKIGGEAVYGKILQRFRTDARRPLPQNLQD